LRDSLFSRDAPHVFNSKRKKSGALRCTRIGDLLSSVGLTAIHLAKPEKVIVLTDCSDQANRLLFHKQSIDENECVAIVIGWTETRKVAYFSMEIGIEEGMPTYSGGLGIGTDGYLSSAHERSTDATTLYDKLEGICRCSIESEAVSLK
jgi:hypothetical protein